MYTRQQGLKAATDTDFANNLAENESRLKRFFESAASRGDLDAWIWLKSSTDPTKMRAALSARGFYTDTNAAAGALKCYPYR
jgi:hypothetical protein